MNSKNIKFDQFIGLMISFLLFLVIVIAMVQANMDLITGRYALFYDEWITFDGVKKLLIPGSTSNFIQNIIDGIYLYGRGLMYLSASAAFVPNLLFGDPGIIATNRIFQGLILLGTNALICFYFLRSRIIGALCFCILSTLPSAIYYSTMPKPEPIQLLSLAIFLILASKNSLRFGYYWFFLGYSFGMKISVAPAIILFGFIALFYYGAADFVFARKIFNKKMLLITKRILRPLIILLGIHAILLGAILLEQAKALCPYLCGYSLNKLREYFLSSNPVLLRNIGLFSISVGLAFVAISLVRENLIVFFKRISAKKEGLLLTAIFSSFGFIFANPGALFKMPIGLMVWVRSTFFISNISDNREVNIFSWAEYMPEYLNVNATAFYAFICLSASLISLNLYRSYTNNTAKSSHMIPKDYSPYIILALGLCLIIPIILVVKRMWGMYLHNGLTFTSLSIFMLVERNCKELKKFNSLKGLSLGVLVILFVFGFYQFRHATDAYKTLSQRTQNSVHIGKMVEYRRLTSYLKRVSKIVGRELNVLYDSRLYVPDSGNSYTISSFWQYLIPWDKNVDFVVSLTDNYPEVLPSSKTKAYQNAVESIKNMERYVESEDSKCTGEICYMNADFKDGKIDIFVNKNISTHVGPLAKKSI